MLVYLILAILNVFLAHLADVFYSTSKVKVFFSLSFIVVIDTFIIGLRDFGVGTDTIVYIDDYFDYAKSLNSLSYFFVNSDGYDKGYVALAYISSLFSKDSQSLMITTEFFIIFFIVLGLYELKKSIDFRMSLFMLLFWLLNNHETINLMRQFCAISLLFWGYSKFLQNKILYYITIQIVAYFFHSSSFLFLLVPLASYFSTFNSNIKYYYMMAVFSGLLLLLFFYYYVLSLIGDAGLLKDVYMDRYGIGSQFASEVVVFGIRDAVRYFLSILIVVFMVRKKLLSSNYRYILLCLFISVFLLEQMRFVIIFFFRLSFYISVVMFVYYSKLLNDKFINKFVVLLYIFFLIINSYYNYSYQSQTINVGNVYHSKILGIE